MFRPCLWLIGFLALGNLSKVEAQKTNRDYEGQWSGYGDEPRLSKVEQIGKIHPAGPKTLLLSVGESFFEVSDRARVGAEVLGRVNLANNSLEKAHFSITGGSGRSFFSIRDFVNSRGKHFGIIQVNSEALSERSYTLRVKAEFDGGESDEEVYTIHRVAQPLAERFLELKEKEYTEHRRLSAWAPDPEIETLLAQFQPDGSFADLPLGMRKDGWENTCASAERLLIFAVAYLDEESRFHGDQALKETLYTGILRNAQKNARFRTDWADTHVWRNSDFIAGIGIRFFRTLREEMNSSDVLVSKRALEVYDALLDVCDVLWAERMEERPAIGNANRNHRMRSLITRAAISYDYNRALTDQDVWYDTVDPRIPGFYPNGCLGDVMELIETGFVFADTYNNQNGFFPDGTICHHPRVGIQFTADAYGWEWLVENSIPMADFLKNTRYRATDSMYNTIADRILDAYRPLTFNGYLDMSVGGLLPDRSKWGPDLLNAVSGLLAAKSNDTVIDREKELREFKATLQNNRFVDELTLNQPFWNIDYLVHRRSGYFASAKMISTRSRGLERGIDRRSYYYLGDGALFVRVDDDAYNGLSDACNWHAIPGTTAEQRLDALPLAADSPFPGANGTNTFAGVVSDGLYGFGAFVYERNHPDDAVHYSTVNANKAFFFFENEILALGNSIRRVRPGDGQEIWTTLNQDAWKTDMVFSGSGETPNTVPVASTLTERSITVKNTPVFFHQNKMGYVILPGEKEAELKLLTGPRAKGIRLFQLAINHGSHPEDDQYRYVILPNTTPGEVEAYANSLREQPPFTIVQNDERAIAVHHHALKITQAAFYQPGSLSIPVSSGYPLKLSVDRPALVMLRERKDSLSVTVTDPHHSTTDTIINVMIDRKLTGPECLYDSRTGLSRLTFTHSDKELYAGRPGTASFARVLTD